MRQSLVNIFPIIFISRRRCNQELCETGPSVQLKARREQFEIKKLLTFLMSPVVREAKSSSRERL